MARGGTSKKTHGWAIPQSTDKVMGGGFSWFHVAVTICCLCSSVYVLQLILSRGRTCGGSAISLLHASSLPPPLQQKPLLPIAQALEPTLVTIKKSTDLTRIVFGIAGAAKNWPKRKEYIKQWWRSDLRGFVWLDAALNKTETKNNVDGAVPPFRISGDTSGFKYSFRGGKRSAIRISRIVSETFRLGLPDVDWFVMGDDDTFFFPDNLVKVLSKYDPKLMYYIGSNSESHQQNILYSFGMAFGGGGFAISYPLAKELAKMQDDCLARYPQVFGSDSRIHACMSELGVPLTKEPGFHQMDIHGDAFGFLAAHPLNPLVSIHHMDVINPIFPNHTRQSALAHLMKASKVESASLLQQSICYADDRKWSISVSWGYVVQIYRDFVTPQELETPIKTFYSCRHKSETLEFPFNTRETPKDICQRPSVYFMESALDPGADTGGLMESVYVKYQDWKRKRNCEQKLQPLSSVQRIRVRKEPVQDSWFEAPRRSCCRVKAWRTDTIEIQVGACQGGEGIASSFM